MPYGVEVDGFLEDACLFYNEVALFTPIRDKQRLFLVLKKFQCKPKKRIVFRVSVVEKQIDNDKTTLYETYQRSYGIYCIADDFCKEYELELNKKALSLSNSSPNTLKLAIEREECAVQK